MFKYYVCIQSYGCCKNETAGFSSNRVLDIALGMLFHAYSNVFEKYVVSVTHHILQIMPHK